MLNTQHSQHSLLLIEIELPPTLHLIKFLSLPPHRFFVLALGSILTKQYFLPLRLKFDEQSSLLLL
jgi:hypothetical protein